MAFKLAERVQETTTTTGTGTLDLLGPVASAYSFGSQLSNGDTTYYVLTDGTDTEVGIGTYTSTSGQKLSRDTVIYSSQGGALVNWSAGTRNVFIGLPASVIASLIAGGATNGFLAQTADRTYARRTLTAGYGISITDGDGIAGNPTINQTVIPAGTRMLFYQAAAPTGWTQVTTHNNKALRVVSGTGAGSGGATAFTSVFGASKATSSHTLSTTEIPAHQHTFSTGTTTDGSHSHTYVGISVAGASSRINAGTIAGALASTDAAGSHSHTLSGTTDVNTSAGGGHTHDLSLNLQYVDVIICELDAAA